MDYKKLIIELVSKSNNIEKLTGISYDKCFGNNNIGYKE